MNLNTFPPNTPWCLLVVCCTGKYPSGPVLHGQSCSAHTEVYLNTHSNITMSGQFWTSGFVSKSKPANTVVAELFLWANKTKIFFFFNDIGRFARLQEVHQGTDQSGHWRWREQARKQMGSQPVRLTKWVYVSVLPKPHSCLSGALFFPPFCPYCSAPHTHVTLTSQADRMMGATVKITLTVRALSTCLMLSGRDANSSYRTSFKGAPEVIAVSATYCC